MAGLKFRVLLDSKDKNETFNITSSKIWELIDKLQKKRETFEAKEREKTKSIHKQE